VGAPTAERADSHLSRYGQNPRMAAQRSLAFASHQLCRWQRALLPLVVRHITSKWNIDLHLGSSPLILSPAWWTARRRDDTAYVRVCGMTDRA